MPTIEIHADRIAHNEGTNLVIGSHIADATANSDYIHFNVGTLYAAIIDSVQLKRIVGVVNSDTETQEHGIVKILEDWNIGGSVPNIDTQDNVITFFHSPLADSGEESVSLPTSLVQAWVDGTEPNYGLCIYPVAVSVGDDRQYSDYILVVEYHYNPPEPNPPDTGMDDDTHLDWKDEKVIIKNSAKPYLGYINDKEDIPDNPVKYE
jgi:hypothetical protein